jgi:hypothetical protein
LSKDRRAGDAISVKVSFAKGTIRLSLQVEEENRRKRWCGGHPRIASPPHIGAVSRGTNQSIVMIDCYGYHQEFGDRGSPGYWGSHVGETWSKGKLRSRVKLHRLDWIKWHVPVQHHIIDHAAVPEFPYHPNFPPPESKGQESVSRQEFKLLP